MKYKEFRIHMINLEKEANRAELFIKENFEHLPNGLVSEKIRVNPKYREACRAAHIAFQTLLAANTAFLKKFNKEYLSERKTRIAAGTWFNGQKDIFGFIVEKS